MSEEWKDTIRWVVYCAVIALVVLVFCTLLTSLRAEQSANDALRADRDEYRRASAEYAKREGELEGTLAEAQGRASVAESTARNAQGQFDEYQRRVVERERTIGKRINDCLASLAGIDDSLDRCLRLADLCISIDKLIEPSAY